MSDTSPEVWGIPTYPNRENLGDWLEAICKEQLRSGDQLWFFFSGYGVSHEGEDYLVPIDGNPANIEATGISLKILFEKLQETPASELLVLLDINRSQGARAGGTVGAATIELANQMAIPTILSCQPDQVSRETSALRHGFFTAALLEGLYSGQYKTVQSLGDYLSNYLPQLTDQHLRPKQNPVCLLNSGREVAQMLLPSQLSVTAAIASRNGNSLVNSAVEPKNNGISPQVLENQVNSPLNSDSSYTKPTSQERSNQPTSTTSSPPSSHSTSTQIDSPAPQNSTQDTMSDKSFLQQLFLWSSATALLLLLGVFYTNKSTFLSRPTANPPLSTTPPESIENTLAPISQVQSSPDSTPGNNTNPETSQLNSQMVLERSKSTLQNTSASGFSNAITIASQIPERDPLYPEAQENIERWSQTILSIAEGRAAVGNFPDAIAAAKLVPQTNRSIYDQAQLQIQKWEQKQQQIEQSFAPLQAAQAGLRPGQASSYNNAITQLRKIKPDEASYQQAQQLISQWSAEILKIAQSRAQKKQFESAIQAARLVPANTQAHDAAQKAITTWQTQLKNTSSNRNNN